MVNAPTRRERALPAILDVRQQITISDGAVNSTACGAGPSRAGRRRWWPCARWGLSLGRLRPDDRARAVPGPSRLGPPGRSAGPYDGIVLDADTDRPIAGATVAASWAFERGIGLAGARPARSEVVAETGADGRYTDPAARRPAGRGVDARPPLHADRLPPGPRRAGAATACSPAASARRDFSQRGNRVRLERWQSSSGTPSTWCSWAAAHGAHGGRVGAAARGAGAGGRAGAAAAGRRGEPSAAGDRTTAAPLDISQLLTDDEIRGVTGYVGKFEDGKLTDLPTTEFYDSRHFKARGQARELRRRPARLAPRHRGGRGAVSQADEHAARSQDDRRGGRRLLPRAFGRHRRRSSTWCASAAWSCR